MANPYNLKPFDNSAEGKRRASEAGKIGGKKSVETHRRKKAMRESLEILLSLPIKSGKQVDIEGIKNFASLKGKNISVEQAMLLAQISKALKGDTQAMTFLRDTSGQKPVEQAKVETNSTEAGLLAEIVGQLKSDE